MARRLSSLLFAPRSILALAGVLLLTVPRAASGQGRESWETWWQYNRDPLLELKSKIHRPQFTVDADFTLGTPSESNRNDFDTPERTAIRNKVIPALREALGNEFFGIRGAAAVALGKTGEPSELGAILKLLRDEHKRVRESAVLGLGALASPKAIEPLVGVMRDDRKGRRLVNRTEILTRTRALAAMSLGLIGHYNPGSRSVVYDQLRRSFDHNQSPKDLPMVILVALGVMQDKRAIPFLTDQVKNAACPDVLRAQAVSALGKIGHRSSLPLVQRALKDKSAEVVRAAIQALGQLAPEGDPQSIKLLAAWALEGREPMGRAWALLSLGRIGGDDSRRILLRTLEQDQDWRKAYAALGLAFMAKRSGDTSDADSDAELVHRVFRMMKGDGARAGLATALGLMGHRAARYDLLDLAVSKGDPGLKGFCAVSLGLMQARDTLPVLKRSLASKIDPGFQTSVAEALGLMGDVEVVPLLLDILQTAETTYHVSSVVQALGFIADQTAIDPLIEILRDPEHSNGNRVNAAMALGVLADARPLPTFHVIQKDVNYVATVGTLRMLLNVQ